MNSYDKHDQECASQVPLTPKKSTARFEKTGQFIEVPADQLDQQAKEDLAMSLQAAISNINQIGMEDDD